MTKTESSNIFISPKEKTNFQELKDLLYSNVKEMHIKRYPYNVFLY
jgi:GTPase